MMSLGILFSLFLSPAAFAHGSPNAQEFISIAATTREQRTEILNLGVSIDEVYSDRVWALVSEEEIARLEKNHFKILTRAPREVYDRAESFTGAFPKGDERYHTYQETLDELNALAKANPDLARVQSIGKSIEGRDLMAIHINSSTADLNSGMSSKPGIFYMGAHHAREHLSVEVPLMLAQYLLKNKADPKIAPLLKSRDIWILPMVNPDGAEYDIDGGRYHSWRKNRRADGGKAYGVDLNRNYGYQWGTGGSSSMQSSDVYMGPKPFSEPETQAIRDFVDARANLKTLLSFHTYSELILYPWGHTHDPISNTQDLKSFETMAKTMAKWNGYTPQASSELYIASGDTVDWAYGTHGIFAFTFELTPKNGFFGGGFYPGAKVIDSTFNANLNPCLYLLDLTDEPHRAITQGAGASIWYK